MTSQHDDPLSWGNVEEVATYAAMGPASPMPRSPQQHSPNQLTELDLGTSSPAPDAGTTLYPPLPLSQSEHAPHPPGHTSYPSIPSFGTTDTLAPPPAEPPVHVGYSTWDTHAPAPPSQQHPASHSAPHPASGWANADTYLRDDSPAQHDNQQPSITVTVGQAVKVAGNNSISLPGVEGGYWEYPLSTRTSLASWPHSEMEVKRRFRDFVALSELLTATLPGYFLPQRPHRNAVQAHRASTRFMDKRRAALERYLARLVAHPVVRASAPLQVFLQAPGHLDQSPAWAALQPPRKSFMRSTTKLFKQMVGSESVTPSVRDVTRSARASGDVLRLLREQLAALQGVTKGAPISPLERELRDAGAAMEETRKAMAQLSTAMRLVVTREKERSHACQDLSKALQTLAMFEQTCGYSSGVCEGRAAEGVHRAAEAGLLCGEHMAQIATSLQEHVESIPLAQGALLSRERALLTQLTLEDTLNKKRSALDQANAQGPAGFQRAQTLTNTCLELQTVLSAARDEYTRLSERNSEALVVWQGATQRELLAAARDLAKVQVTASERSAQLWRETADSLQNLRQ